jgi:hypothetical protein
MGGCAECLFKGIGAYQWGRTIVFILLEYILRDVYPAMLCVQLLHTALTGEDVCEVVDSQGLLRSRMDGRHGLVGHVSLNVVPLCWNLTLLEDEFFLFRHNN